MNFNEFLNAVKKLNINLNEKQQEQLEDYANFLIEYNQHTNITAITDKEKIYLKHFYDSLMITKSFHPQNEKVLDIGTGGGFPGLVLAICFPTLTVDLLDSNHKKIDFLNQFIEKEQILNAHTIYQRSEEYAKTTKEKYDIITSRAVAELRILLEISFPLLKVGGYFLAMKSNKKEELENAIETVEILNGTIKEKEIYTLPTQNDERCIIKIQKEKLTPKNYPRPYQMILKKPLKKKNF